MCKQTEFSQFENILSSFIDKHLLSQNINSSSSSSISVFHSKSIPSISLSKYAIRFIKYCNCFIDHIILSLYYIERFLNENTSLCFDNYTAHRLFLSSIVISSKYDNDFRFSNIIFAKIGGVSLKELNSLELHFLDKINYNLYISYKEYTIYKHMLLSK